VTVPSGDSVFTGAIPRLYETYLVPLIFEPYAADLAERLASRSVTSVLEIAAGTGVVTRRLAVLLGQDASIVATDLNRLMLDEAAADTPWGGSGTWARHSLLAMFHNENEGGEKVFQLMARLAEKPAVNLDLLELIYCALTLGFEGRYRVIDNGRAQLEAVRDRLAQIIRQQRGDHAHALAQHWQGQAVARRGATSWLPLAATAAEGRELEAAGRVAGRLVQVGHIFRFHPVTATLREALGAGRIGRVRYATGRFAGFKRPRADGGVTQADAIHYFDLFAYLFDRDATRVDAIQRDYLGRGLDDLSWTVVHYGDIPVSVEANYFVPGNWRECVIVGDHGALVADFNGDAVSVHLGEHRRHGDAWEAVETGKEELPVNGEEPLRLELSAFLDACAGKAPNLAPAAVDPVHEMVPVAPGRRPLAVQRQPGGQPTIAGDR